MESLDDSSESKPSELQFWLLFGLCDEGVDGTKTSGEVWRGGKKLMKKSSSKKSGDDSKAGSCGGGVEVVSVDEGAKGVFPLVVDVVVAAIVVVVFVVVDVVVDVGVDLDAVVVGLVTLPAK